MMVQQITVIFGEIESFRATDETDNESKNQ